MPASGIGVQKEKALHADLKRRYAGDGGAIEVPVGAYVCDAVRQGGEIVEIQTGNFGAIAKKLEELGKGARVRLVHPIAARRVIELRSMDGELIRRRTSPKKGSHWDLFAALVRSPRLPLFPGLVIESVLVEETELRTDDGAGSWRRKGVSLTDRRLDAILETRVWDGPADFEAMLPAGLPSPFSAANLAAAASIKADLARRAVYVLARIGVLEEAGKLGRAKGYALKSAAGKRD